MFNKIRQKRYAINALRNYSDEQNIKYLRTAYHKYKENKYYA